MRLINFVIIIAGLIFIGACSSDKDTPLGAEFLEDSLIRSRPGQVAVDTIRVTSGDKTVLFRSVLATTATMSLGRKNEYETWPLVRIKFSPPGTGATKSVARAELKLRVTSSDQTDTLGARFFELLDPFAEGDTLRSLNLAASPIPDSSLTEVDRRMSLFPGSYTLPPALVEDWIKGTSPHNGVAVVLNDTTTTKELVFGSKQNANSGFRPFLSVFFTDGSDTNYTASGDGTFVQPLESTQNLVLSDGATRRVFVPVDLSPIGEKVLLHDARLTLHLVPGTAVGADLTVTLYAPDGDRLGVPGVFSGTAVTAKVLNPGSGELVLSVRNIFEQFLTGKKPNFGLALRFAVEGTGIRQAEFFSSSAPDSLQPAFRLTVSTPPEFPK